MSINKLTATVHNAWLRLKSEDRGASVVEWVLITLAVLGVVGIITGLLGDALKTKAEEVEKTISGKGVGGGGN